MYFIKTYSRYTGKKIVTFSIIQYMCNGQPWQDVSRLTLLKLYLDLIDLDKFTAEKSIIGFEIQGTPPSDSVSCKATVNQILEDYLEEVSLYIYSVLTFFPSIIEERK